MKENDKKQLFIRGWDETAGRIGYSKSGLKLLVRKGFFPALVRPTYRTVLWDLRVAERWRDAVLRGEVKDERGKKWEM